MPIAASLAASSLQTCSRACRPAPARHILVEAPVAAPRCHTRRNLQLCRGATSEAEASAAAAPEPAVAEAQGEQPDEDLEARKPKRMADSWNEVVQWKKEQKVIETMVKTANRSGLIVQVGKLTGFLPYKLVDPSRLQQRRPDGSRIAPPPNGHQSLVGQRVRVKITQVIVPENRLIVSEKAVLLDELAAAVQPGDIIDGVVGSTMDWGAFVECQSVNGEPCPRAEVVLPMREISYAWLSSASEGLTTSQPIKVLVLHRTPAPDAKVVVSLKRLEEDPLKETLDNVLPPGKQAGDYEQLSVPASVPQGVDEILEALDREESVESITLGRCVEEKRTVSQDLELWITKETVAGGYNLAVRAGRVVQEVIVGTQMSPEEMRATVQRVLRSIN